MIFSFYNPQRFVAGTVGQPGERAFFLQATQDSTVVAIGLEKTQLQAMVSRLEMILSEIRKSTPLAPFEKTQTDDKPLESPIDSQFVVGAISLAWDSELERICVELYELQDDEESNDGDKLVAHLSLGVAAAFCIRSQSVINAGRLPCPFCSIPIDPRGHLCPRANGYRR